MQRNKRSSTFGFSVIDLLSNLTIIFLVLSLTISDTPSTPKLKTDNMLVVTLEWPLKTDADVDLWVEAPGDQPTGYSRSHGLHFDLVRDDLGTSQDPLSRNLEMQVSRDSPAGEYTVNAVMYNSHDLKFPVPVTVSVNYGNYSSILLEAHGVLDYDGQEITVVRFTLDKNGRILDENHLYKQLFFPNNNAAD